MNWAVIVEIIIAMTIMLLQFGAAYFSFVIYRYNRLSKDWLAVTIALWILGVRGVITLFSIVIPEQATIPQWFTVYLSTFDTFTLAFTVSILLFFGLRAMKRNFESFDILEKKTKEKIKSFTKSGKKSRKR